MTQSDASEVICRIKSRIFHNHSFSSSSSSSSSHLVPHTGYTRTCFFAHYLTLYIPQSQVNTCSSNGTTLFFSLLPHAFSPSLPPSYHHSPPYLPPSLTHYLCQSVSQSVNQSVKYSLTSLTLSLPRTSTESHSSF